MREKNLFKYFLLIFVSLLTSLIFTAPSQTVQAETNIPDGITNWKQSSSNTNAYLKMNNRFNLGYTFGLATSTGGGGYTVNGADTTLGNLTNDSSRPKMNIFIQDKDGNASTKNLYLSTVLQGPKSTPENVSTSSPDFMIVPDKDTAAISQANYSVLKNLQNKIFWIGSDDNGNPAYKVTGHLFRSNIYGTFDLDVEILLRASPSGSAIVQREMYIQNNSDHEQSYGIMFSEDTALLNGDGDDVPIRTLADNGGLYISKMIAADKITLKLLIGVKTPDGPANYNGMSFNGSELSGGSGNNWVKCFEGSNFAGAGAEAQNYPAGKQVSSGDSAYSLKWPYATIKAGETKHYSSTMGVAVSSYASPIANKSYVNQTSTDGKNRIGDRLKFTLKMANNGANNSKWTMNNFTDQIPDGLTIDPNSIKLTTSAGTVDKDPSLYQTNSKTLIVPNPVTLNDDETTSLTFEATINSDASGQTIINIGQFIGKDPNYDSGDKTFTSEADIPVEKAPYSATFTKQLKNVTDNTDYSETADGKMNDIIAYQIKYQVNANSGPSLNIGAKLSDDLPAGLQLVPGSITVNYSNGDSADVTDLTNISLNKVAAGESVTVDFQAKVTQSAAGVINNTASITDAKTSDGDNIDNSDTNVTSLNVENVDGFTEVPTNIDFGITHMVGTDKSIKNINTNGNLIVSHPSGGSYWITVSYNSKSENALQNTGGDNIPNDNYFFIKQRTNSYTDIGTWEPILSTGTRIQTDGFQGNQDLTNYVGVDNWKLDLDSSTAPGAYNGTITWGLVDSV